MWSPGKGVGHEKSVAPLVGNAGAAAEGAHLEWALAEWRQSDLQEHCYFQLPASRPAVCQCSWPRRVRASSSARAALSPEAYLPRTRWCGVHCLTARPYSISLVGADCCLGVVPEQPVRPPGRNSFGTWRPALGRVQLRFLISPTACRTVSPKARQTRARDSCHGKLSRHRGRSNPHSGIVSSARQCSC